MAAHDDVECCCIQQKTCMLQQKEKELWDGSLLLRSELITVTGVTQKTNILIYHILDVFTNINDHVKHNIGVNSKFGFKGIIYIYM